MTPAGSSHHSYGAVHDRTQHSSLPLGVKRGYDERPVPQGAADASRGGQRWLKFVAVGSLAVMTLAAAIVAIDRTRNPGGVTQGITQGAGFIETSSGHEERAEAGTSGLAPLAFTALNFYQERDGKPGQHLPWLDGVKLVEPHRETTMAVSNSRDGHQYRWEVRAGTNTGVIYATTIGAEVTMVLTQLDENVIKLEEVDAQGLVTRQLEETVMVKYVRREIRRLTDSEREELLDAMHTLWAVKYDEGGTEMYGDDYTDIWVMNRVHHLAASGGSCDHFHDGVGFLTSHILLTNIFEHSLRLVNPKLSLSYWDFTIEESSSADVKYDPADPTTRTPLLQSSWFGTFDRDDKMVKDGRWAYTKIPRVREGSKYVLERSGVYSKLRSPWNINNRQYVTRGAGEMCGLDLQMSWAWPTCKIHYDLINDYHSFFEWSWESMYWPHGPVHFWLGGFLDCAETFHQVAELVGPTIANRFVDNAGCTGLSYGIAIGTWKTTKLQKSGVCGCQGYDLTQGDDYKTIGSVLKIDEYIGDFDEDTQQAVVNILCSGVIAFGDQTQSSSSLDPMFWPMHPTMERLWQFSVLTGSVTDFHWPDTDISYVTSDGETVWESLSLYDDTCVGQRGSDVFPFDLLKGDTTGVRIQTGIKGQREGENTLTNREVLESIDPRSSMVPYVYDNLKWDHCAIDGYNFEDIEEKRFSGARSHGTVDV